MAATHSPDAESIKPLLAGLEDGAIVMIAPEHRRIMNSKGVWMRRPRIGVRLRYRLEGEIMLRAGRIAGGDLLCGGYDRAFTLRVEPGTYSVMTVYAETTTQSVAAFGVIRLTDTTAAKCQLALFEDEDPAEVTEEMGGGLGTDSGTIALGEPDDPSGGHEVPEEEMEAFRLGIDNGFGKWPGCKIVTSPRGGTVCVWRSGFGDGMYTPYWGVGRGGEICYLAVDFGVVANGLHAPAVRMRSVGDSLELEPKNWWDRWLKR